MELWIRDLILLKETGDWNLIINKDKSSLLSKQAARFTSKGLQDMIQKIELARTMLKSNTNYQLTIETMLYQFWEEQIMHLIVGARFKKPVNILFDPSGSICRKMITLLLKQREVLNLAM